MIRVAVILRLLFTAVLLLRLAYAYSDEHENLFRLYQGSKCLIIIVFGFLLDTILTILWLYSPIIFNLHLALNCILVWGLYAVYSIDLINASGIAEMLAFGITPFIWLIGLIPFIICEKGNSKLKIAEIAQNREA